MEFYIESSAATVFRVSTMLNIVPELRTEVYRDRLNDFKDTDCRTGIVKFHSVKEIRDGLNYQ